VIKKWLQAQSPPPHALRGPRLKLAASALHDAARHGAASALASFCFFAASAFFTS
jgi:hypothetical protein